MTCTGCGAPRAIQDRICKSCRLCWETGRKVDVEPPRAAPGRARPLAPPSALSRGWSRIARQRDRLPSFVPFRTALAGIVPGLGHALSGAPRRGAAYAAGVLALLLLGAGLFSGVAGQVIFGLAVALHAYSVFELTPWRVDERAHARIGAILAIQFVLAVIYRPLFVLLANSRVASIRTYDDSGLRAGPVFVAVLAAVAAALALRIFSGVSAPPAPRGR